jgi:hypothetical protein
MDRALADASRGWRKIKTAAWRAANRERWRLFERRLRCTSLAQPKQLRQPSRQPPRNGQRSSYRPTSRKENGDKGD